MINPEFAERPTILDALRKAKVAKLEGVVVARGFRVYEILRRGANT